MKASLLISSLFLLSIQHQVTHVKTKDTLLVKDMKVLNIQSSCTVRLKAPANNTELGQNSLGDGRVESIWRFTWFPCQEATKYHLYVIHNTALNPVINNDSIRAVTYLDKAIHYGITALDGWTWKVRAYVRGQWSEWSEIRRFRVMPVPCIISGKITGPMEGEYYSDAGGEHYKIKMEKVFLTTPDGTRKVREAIIRNREYVFKNVPSGKSYRVYPDRRFKSNPEYIEIRDSKPNENYKRNNFAIAGVKPEG
jgi:hypothetical protein